MSSATFLETLLDGAEVEWKPLGEVASLITKGTTPKAFTESGANFIKLESIDSNRINVKKCVFISHGTHTKELKRSILEVDDILFAIAGSLGKCAIVEKSVLPANTNQALAIVRLNNSVIVKFVFYYMQTMAMKEYIEKFNKTSAQPNLNLRQISDFKIPIPCPDNPKKSLEIQAKIARILDSFTEHTAALTVELAAELTAHKKRYNYYRDRLLTFQEGEVEWKTLGEVTLPTSNIKWREVRRAYRYIDLTSVSIETKAISKALEITSSNAPSRAQKLIEKDDVIFATTRPTLKRYCLIDDDYSGEIASTGYCVLRPQKREVLPRWLLHWVASSDFNKYVEENQSGSAYPAISDAKVKEFKIPIPPLEKQKEIVAILDKFDALTNSLTEGLPREIELRQKQYEYYRDQLLSFPKSSNS